MSTHLCRCGKPFDKHVAVTEKCLQPAAQEFYDPQKHGHTEGGYWCSPPAAPSTAKATEGKQPEGFFAGEVAITPEAALRYFWNDEYVDERLGRDASWPNIIEAANYCIAHACVEAVAEASGKQWTPISQGGKDSDPHDICYNGSDCIGLGVSKQFAQAICDLHTAALAAARINEAEIWSEALAAEQEKHKKAYLSSRQRMEWTAERSDDWKDRMTAEINEDNRKWVAAQEKATASSEPPPRKPEQSSDNMSPEATPRGERSELVHAAQEALVAIAAWAISDTQKFYAEVSDDLRKQFMKAHDLLLAALKSETKAGDGLKWNEPK